MRVIDASKSQMLNLGFAGETERTQVRFYYGDIAAEFPGGTLILQHKRPGETTKYSIQLDTEDGYAIWTVSNYDCARKGQGECQLIYSQGSAIAKKKIWKTWVARSLEGSDATIPDTWQDIEAELLAAAGTVSREISEAQETIAADLRAAEAAQTAAEAAQDSAEQAKDEALASATSASESEKNSEAWAVGQRDGADVQMGDETYQNNSKFYAEVAKQGAEEVGYIWFDVNEQDGKMYVTTTDNLADDINFTVNEQIGTLEVTFNNG